MQLKEQPGEQPKRGQQTRKNKPTVKIKPARGIQLLPIKEGPRIDKPYGVMWRVHRGRGGRPSEYFATIEQLENKISQLNRAKRGGELRLVPTPDETAEWRVFKSRCDGHNPLDILEEWRALRTVSGNPVCSLRVGKAVEDFLNKQADRVAKGHISRGHYKQKVAKLEKFKTEFAGHLLTELETDDIEEWCDSLEEVKADTTWNDHVKKVRELYDYYEDLVPRNPAARIELKNDEVGVEERVMPVQQVAKLFGYALRTRPYLLPRLASEFFLGLRFATAKRLKRSNFKLEDKDEKIVDLMGAQMKAGRAHYISSNFAPANYWTWLDAINDERCWKLSESEYMHAKSALFAAAEIPHPKNAARHSFASYHIAAFQDAPLTSLVLHHANTTKLLGVYRAKAKRADGRLFFSLMPKTVEAVATKGTLPETRQIELPLPRGSAVGAPPML